MGKFSAAARDFPFYRRAQSVSFDRCQKEIFRIGKMFVGCVLGLLGGREMDIAAYYIDGSPKGLALCLQGLPFNGTEYFVNYQPPPVPCQGKIVNRPFGAGAFPAVGIDSTQQMWADGSLINSGG